MTLHTARLLCALRSCGESPGLRLSYLSPALYADPRAWPVWWRRFGRA